MTGLEIYLPWAIMGGAAVIGIGAVIWSSAMEERRSKAMGEAAQRLGLEFDVLGSPPHSEEFRSLHLFSQGRSRAFYNTMHGKADGTEGLILSDYRYTTGDGKNTQTHRQTVAVVYYPKGDLPRFEFRPENVFHKIGSLFGYQDIDFPSSPEFSKSYLLRGPDVAAIRSLFRINLLQFFEAHPSWCVDGRDGWLAAYRAGRLVRPEDMGAFLDEVKLLLWAFPR